MVAEDPAFQAKRACIGCDDCSRRMCCIMTPAVRFLCDPLVSSSACRNLVSSKNNRQPHTASLAIQPVLPVDDGGLEHLPHRTQADARFRGWCSLLWLVGQTPMASCPFGTRCVSNFSLCFHVFYLIRCATRRLRATQLEFNSKLREAPTASYGRQHSTTCVAVLLRQNVDDESHWTTILELKSKSFHSICNSNTGRERSTNQAARACSMTYIETRQGTMAASRSGPLP